MMASLGSFAKISDDMMMLHSFCLMTKFIKKIIGLVRMIFVREEMGEWK